MHALVRILSVAAVALPALLVSACSPYDSSVGGSPNDPKPGACKAGETKKADDGCNTCSCQADGSWACTEMACNAPCAGPAPSCGAVPDGCKLVGGGCVNGNWSCGDLVCDPGQCKPGEVKPSPDGCNTCSCMDDGSWACTEKACPVECSGPMPSCAAPPPGCDYVGGGCVSGQWTCGKLVCEPQCKPGETKQLDCNTCSCMDDGQWACTAMACPSECKADADCPAPPPVCTKCPDGQEICAKAICDNGICAMTGMECPNPGECKVDSDCPVDAGPCQVCPDGTMACPSADCVGGKCQYTSPGCTGPGPCDPQEAYGYGDCDGYFGYAWDGKECHPVTGCGCKGADCDKIYKDPDECKILHEKCSGECTGPIPDCAPPPPECHYENSGCVNGQWTCGTLVCGPQCKPGEIIPSPDGCNSCVCQPDGSLICTEKGCAVPCDPQDAYGDGLCDAFFGYAWNGKECLGISGCKCVGTDCGNLYKDPTECKVVHEQCFNGGMCKSSADCPQPGAPCEMCPDGTTACPSVDCINGHCVGSFPGCPGGGVGPGQPCKVPGAEAPADDGCNTCICSADGTWGCTKIACPPPPDKCKADSDCPQPDGPCVKCLGTNPCAKSICDMGSCVTIPPICGDVCPAQDAKGDGSCEMFLGYVWNGKECLGIGGCKCVGADCGNLYESQAVCNSIHSACQ